MRRKFRLADELDLHICVYIAGVFHEGSQFRDVTTYSPDDAYHHAKFCLKNPNKLFYVYEKDDKVVGFFIAGKIP